MFSFKSRIFIFLLLACTQNVFASDEFSSNTKTEDKLQVPLIDGISARLIPELSETITFPETYFSFGVYREFLINETASRYTSSGLGVILAFQQHIRGMWSGGIELRWSDWKGKTIADGTKFGNTSPLSVFSKTEMAPDLGKILKNVSFAKMLRPYAVGGIGYTLFFDERSPLSARSKTAFGQISATYGGGIRIILPTSFSIKFGMEQWRGVKTGDYFSNIVFLQLNFGDVSKF